MYGETYRSSCIEWEKDLSVLWSRGGHTQRSAGKRETRKGKEIFWMHVLIFLLLLLLRRHERSEQFMSHTHRSNRLEEKRERKGGSIFLIINIRSLFSSCQKSCKRTAGSLFSSLFYSFSHAKFNVFWSTGNSERKMNTFLWQNIFQLWPSFLSRLLPILLLLLILFSPSLGYRVESCSRES